MADPVLARLPLFSELTEAEVETVGAFMRRRRYAKRSLIHAAGAMGADFYVIESGRVAVLDDGQEIRRLGPGDSFGEIALLRSVLRTATVRALEDTELAALNGPQFVSAVTGFSATSSTAEQLVSGYLSDDLQRHAIRPRTDPDSTPDPR